MAFSSWILRCFLKFSLGASCRPWMYPSVISPGLQLHRHLLSTRFRRAIYWNVIYFVLWVQSSQWGFSYAWNGHFIWILMIGPLIVHCCAGFLRSIYCKVPLALDFVLESESLSFLLWNVSAPSAAPLGSFQRWAAIIIQELSERRPRGSAVGLSSISISRFSFLSWRCFPKFSHSWRILTRQHRPRSPVLLRFRRWLQQNTANYDNIICDSQSDPSTQCSIVKKCVFETKTVGHGLLHCTLCLNLPLSYNKGFIIRAFDPSFECKSLCGTLKGDHPLHSAGLSASYIP